MSDCFEKHNDHAIVSWTVVRSRGGCNKDPIIMFTYMYSSYNCSSPMSVTAKNREELASSSRSSL